MEIKFEIIKATCKGVKTNDLPNQDFILIDENERHLIVTISDGLGSSINSLEGASLACKVVGNYFKAPLQTLDPLLIKAVIPVEWDKIIRIKTGKRNDYRTANSFVIILKQERKIIIGRLGDVYLAVRIDGIHIPLANFEKEFINETKCLGSEFKHEYEILLYSFQNNVDFLLASDGIGDELLSDKIVPLFDYLKTKYSNVERKQRNRVLKKEIVQTLNDKNDDDKSLVFAWSK